MKIATIRTLIGNYYHVTSGNIVPLEDTNASIRRDTLISMLKNKDFIESVILDLEIDLSIFKDDLYFTELNNSYVITINELKNLIKLK